MKIGTQLRQAAPGWWNGAGVASDMDRGSVTSLVRSSEATALASSSEPSPSKGRFWQWFTVVSLIVILAAAARWIFDHPYAVHADEAAYINEVQLDVQRLQSGNLVRLAGRILLGDRNRPPAYRVLAIPILALAGFHTSSARFVSLALLGMSLYFVYLIGRRVASYVAGSVAVLFFLLSSEVVAASIIFGTEGPLFLATSATLYYLSAYWGCGSERPPTWIGLGLAISLGLLAKTSFALMLFPVFAYTLFVSRKQPGRPGFASLLKGGVLAVVVAGPWWAVNGRSALGFAKHAVDSPRNSVGTPGLHTWVTWSTTIAQGLLGYGLAIIIILVAISTFRKIVVRREPILKTTQRTALTACACAAIPIVVVQATGVNHLLRYLTPALIPSAVIVGVLADQIGWTRRWQHIAPLALCFALQLIMIAAPVVFPNSSPVDPGFSNGGVPWRTLVRFEQWDWQPLRDISRGCGLDAPRISFLGNGRTFTPSHIQYPWIAGGTRPPDVKWLWHYEEGPLDWQRVWGSVAASDIVITAPRYVGQVSDWQDRDNQHNSELAGQICQDPRFRQPIHLEMGRFESVDVLVFSQSGPRVSLRRRTGFQSCDKAACDAGLHDDGSGFRF